MLKTVKKILEWVIALEFIVFLVPWLVFLPEANLLFPQSFVSYGWMYSMLAIFALALTFLIYTIVRYFYSKSGGQNIQPSDGIDIQLSDEKDKRPNDDEKITRLMPFILITGFLLWYAIPILLDVIFW